MSHKRQTKSIVWRLFKINDDDQTKVTCSLCNKILSRGGKIEKAFSTTNMRKHLQTQHQEQFEQEELVAEKLAQTTQKRTRNAFSTTHKKSKIDHGPSSGSIISHTQKTLEKMYSRDKIIHDAIGEMIVIDSQPFSIVEDIGFTRLLKLLKPNYELPPGKYFSDYIIPEMHSKVLTQIKKKIDEARNMSFTTNIVTNSTDASFIR